MGLFFDEIPDSLIAWIQKQEMFFVATAPLSGDGHVNVSPKGVRGSFVVESKNRVWYEDLSGSGVETISHLRENKRITIMFCAFEGAARIVRLWGTGQVYEFGTPEYARLIPPEKRLSGSRAAVVVDVHKVGSSCGYAVPYYTFKAHRTALFNWSEKMERLDASFAHDAASCPAEPLALRAPPGATRVYPKRSMKWWWVQWNLRSIDGLPGLDHAHVADEVPRTGEEARPRQRGAPEPPSDGDVVILGNRVPKAGIWERLVLARTEEAMRLVFAFSVGVAFAAVCMAVVSDKACSLR